MIIVVALLASVLGSTSAFASPADSCSRLFVDSGVLRVDVAASPADEVVHVLTRDGIDVLIDVDFGWLKAQGPAALARKLGVAPDSTTSAWQRRLELHLAARRIHPGTFDATAAAAFAGLAGDVLFFRVYRVGDRERAVISLASAYPEPALEPGLASSPDHPETFWFQLPRTSRERFVTLEIPLAGMGALKWFQVHHVPALEMKFHGTEGAFATVMTFLHRSHGRATKDIHQMYFVARDRTETREVWRIEAEARVDVVDALFDEAEFTRRHLRPANALPSFTGDALPSGLHVPDVLLRLKPDGDPGQGESPRETLNAIFAANANLAGDLEQVKEGDLVFAAAPAPAGRTKARAATSLALFTRREGTTYLVAWAPVVVSASNAPPPRAPRPRRFGPTPRSTPSSRAQRATE